MNMPVGNPQSRRTLLSTMGTLAVGATAGCLGTLTGTSEVEQQFEEIRNDHEQYDGEPQKAIEDGFALSGPPVGNMGWHFANAERTNAAIENGFDATKPQILVYDAEWNLGCVEYAAPAAQVEVPDLFDDENTNATEEWGIHKASTHIFATTDDEVQEPSELSWEQLTNPDYWMEFHPPNDDLEPGDEVTKDFGHGEETRTIDMVSQHPDTRTLHAWVFVENPDGPFEPLHPEFAGDIASGGHEH